MSDTLRWCPGEACRDPKPASEFWRGGDLCRECRKEARRQRANARRAEWYRRQMASPEGRERQRRRALEAYHRKVADPARRRAIAARYVKRYREDDAFRLKANARNQRVRRRHAVPVVRCAGRSSHFDRRCTRTTKHASGLCYAHRGGWSRKTAVARRSAEVAA